MAKRMSFLFGEVEEGEEWTKLKDMAKKGVGNLKTQKIKLSDFVRAVVVCLIVSVVVSYIVAPKIYDLIIAIKHREYDRRWEYYTEKINQERKAEEYDLKTPDEKFAEYIMDADSNVINVEILDSENLIFIYIISNKGTSEEAWAIRKEYRETMAEIAAGSKVEKGVCLIGVERGRDVWMIDENGDLVDLIYEKGDDEINV